MQVLKLCIVCIFHVALKDKKWYRKKLASHEVNNVLVC